MPDRWRKVGRVVHGRVPSESLGWDRTACGRQIGRATLDVTDDPAAVTCSRCLSSTVRMTRVGTRGTDA